MIPLYVFALIGEGAAQFTTSRRRIDFIEVNGIWVAAEHRQERPQVSEGELRTQHGIVQAIFDRTDAVLPARFGALVDRGELERIIDLRGDAIRAALALVKGRAQMTVRLFEDAPERAASSSHRAATGTAYLEQRRTAARGGPLPAVGASIAAAVEEFVAAERVEAGRGRIAASLYHLVGRGDVHRYLEALTPFTSSAVTVGGPWAPFAFAPDLWL